MTPHNTTPTGDADFDRLCAIAEREYRAYYSRLRSLLRRGVALSVAVKDANRFAYGASVRNDNTSTAA